MHFACKMLWFLIGSCKANLAWEPHPSHTLACLRCLCWRPLSKNVLWCLFNLWLAPWVHLQLVRVLWIKSPVRHLQLTSAAKPWFEFSLATAARLQALPRKRSYSLLHSLWVRTKWETRNIWERTSILSVYSLIMACKAIK